MNEDTPKVIGFGGDRCAGKDFTADLIIQRLQNRGKFEWFPKYSLITKIAFADALKAELTDIFRALGIVCDWEDRDFKTAARPLLQAYGDYKKNLEGDNYWINRVREKIEAGPKNGLFIVTDVRFPSEIEFVKSYPNHKTVWVTSGDWKEQETQEALVSKHRSENSVNMLDFDIIYTNNPTQTISDLIEELEL